MHPKTMYIRPREGLKIYNFEAECYLPESGTHVPRSAYWLRRLKDGDIEIIDAKPRVQTTVPESVA